MRQNVAGSLKIRIPTNTVPTAPIPVQTAYVVPMGNVWDTFTSKTMLMDRATKKPIYQYVASIPVASLAFPKQAANRTSKRPAMINKIQFMSCNIIPIFLFGKNYPKISFF